MQIDLLANHPSLIHEIACLKLSAFGYMVPHKTLADFLQGLHDHCSQSNLPITYLALEKGQFLGTFSLREYDLPTDRDLTPWIGSVLVHPEKRNQGIGSVLVKEAEKQAAERGYRSLYLFTPNKAAWYAKLGWSVLRSSILNGVPITIMAKVL